MKTIKGFENEDIVVSDFGEWVGKDYIDYKFEYKNNNKIIESLFDKNKQLEEQVAYLRRSCERKEETVVEQQQELVGLDTKIDKAIKYINENLIISSILDGKKTYCLNNYTFDYKELLDILQEKEVSE